jgi:hypothetical protein
MDQQVFEGVIGEKKAIVHANDNNAESFYYINGEKVGGKKYNNWTLDTGSRRPAISETLDWLDNRKH